MSYRAYKKLFGETALELKSRLALAIGVPLLLGISFYVYARQTEGLAYDQLTHTGQVNDRVGRVHFAFVGLDAVLCHAR